MEWTRRMLGGGLLAAGAVSASTAQRQPSAVPPPPPGPVIIAHRGASGERPEHTPSAYGLAVDQGADFIEPDLVVSRDGVLVCRHETEIGATTDVSSRAEFASKRTAKTVDGQRVEGWFAEDFTLAELKTLRCRERIPELRPANTAYDGQEAIVTFAELLTAVRVWNRRTGLVVELKHVAHLAAAGHDLPALALADLKRAGMAGRLAPVIVECFEVAPLRRLRELTDTRLVQLIAATGAPPDAPDRPYADMLTPAGLEGLARDVDGIGPEKRLILPRDDAGRSLPATSLARDARAAGLLTYTWTCRAENAFLPLELRRGDPADPAYSRTRGDLAGEIAALHHAGVDGVFCDHPALAIAARNRLAT